MNETPRRSLLKWLLAFELVLLAATIVVQFDFSSHRVKGEWPWLFVWCQLAGIGGILWRCKLPRRAPEWTALVGSAGFAVLLFVLIVHAEFKHAVYQTLDVSLRIALPLCWVVAVGCLPLLPWLLRRRILTVLRWWVASLATLAVAEPAAWLLESRHDDPLRFPERLPAPENGEIHVAAIGGSSMLGHPYQPKFGLAAVVVWRLRQSYPDRTVVLHNLAGGGINLRGAIERLNTLKVRPHLLLVYSGHNEYFHDAEEFDNFTSSPLSFVDPWMQWSPFFRQLDRWIASRKRLREIRRGKQQCVNRPPATPALYQRRLQRFQNQLRQLNAFCRRERIRQLWFVPAAAESGFEPNRSLAAEGTSAREMADLRRTCEELRTASCQRAIRLCRNGLRAHPQFAEFHFRLGECLERRGQFTEAAHHFRQALDNDGFPIRANRDYREAVRSVAAENGIPLVETAAALRKHAPHGILGSTLFHDNVHMTLYGYYLTGIAGGETIAETGLLAGIFGKPADSGPPRFAQAVQDAGMTKIDVARACRRIAFAFEELSRWRFEPARRERDAARYAHLAQHLADGRIQPGDQGTESLTTAPSGK